MKYYLKITITYFYDNYGDLKYGGGTKEVGTEFDYKGVIKTGDYLDYLDYEKYLNMKGEEYGFDIVDHYFLLPSDWEELGYDDENEFNLYYDINTFKEITSEQYLEYLEIIGKYNNIE